MRLYFCMYVCSDTLSTKDIEYDHMRTKMETPKTIFIDCSRGFFRYRSISGYIIINCTSHSVSFIATID